MPALQVKECPSVVYERLRECAARENRSISQQALTILEGYLGLRGGVDGGVAACGVSACRCGAAPSYAAKRQKAFERIAKLRPLPVSKRSPDSAELLRQAREEAGR